MDLRLPARSLALPGASVSPRVTWGYTHCLLGRLRALSGFHMRTHRLAISQTKLSKWQAASLLLETPKFDTAFCMHNRPISARSPCVTIRSFIPNWPLLPHLNPTFPTKLAWASLQLPPHSLVLLRPPKSQDAHPGPLPQPPPFPQEPGGKQ